MLSCGTEEASLGEWGERHVPSPHRYREPVTWARTSRIATSIQRKTSSQFFIFLSFAERTGLVVVCHSPN